MYKAYHSRKLLTDNFLDLEHFVFILLYKSGKFQSISNFNLKFLFKYLHKGLKENITIYNPENNKKLKYEGELIDYKYLRVAINGIFHTRFNLNEYTNIEEALKVITQEMEKELYDSEIGD